MPGAASTRHNQAIAARTVAATANPQQIVLIATPSDSVSLSITGHQGRYARQRSGVFQLSKPLSVERTRDGPWHQLAFKADYVV